MLNPGDSVEHFVIVSFLGRGGLGHVYLARDKRLKRSVALKVLRTHLEEGASDEERSGGASRLVREAQAAAALEHPNIVTIFDVGEVHGHGQDAGLPFIAMELVKGKPLRAFVGDPSVPIRERVRWLLEIARALAAAHQAGLVHRDIKPENVMVRDDGVIKVLDFGLARRASGLAGTSSSTEGQLIPNLTGGDVAAGTPYYMAPEQMRREPLDGRADQFAWGVVAYELLSGEPPWGRNVDALELVSRLLTFTPRPLLEVAPGVPPSVAAATMRALSKSPADRFETTAGLVAMLEGEGDASAAAPESARRSTSAPSPSRPAFLGRWSQRVAGLLVVGVALYLVTEMGSRVGRDRSPDSVHPPGRSGATPLECSKKSDCVVGADAGGAVTCNPAGHCVSLTSQDCQIYADPLALANDATVWFGTLYPKDDPALQVDFRAVDVARKDFAQMMSGFARERGGPGVHPLGIVACDDGVDAARAARHLVEDVGVPAIVGFRSAAEVVDLGSSLLIPHGVVGVVPLSTSPLVTSLPVAPGQPRLFWRTTYSSVEAAQAIGHLVPDVLEPAIRAAGLGSRAPLRVAYVRGKIRGGSTFDELLFMALRFNGKSALENANDYEPLVLEDERSVDATRAVADRLAAFRPQIIVSVLDSPRATFEEIESRWPRGAPRAKYVTIAPIPDDVLDWIGPSAERRGQFFGMAPQPATSVNARFVMHFNETEVPHVTRADAPNSDYDAFYLLAYATYALGSTPVSGPSGGAGASARARAEARGDHPRANRGRHRGAPARDRGRRVARYSSFPLVSPAETVRTRARRRGVRRSPRRVSETVSETRARPGIPSIWRVNRANCRISRLAGTLL